MAANLKLETSFITLKPLHLCCTPVPQITTNWLLQESGDRDTFIRNDSSRLGIRYISLHNFHIQKIHNVLEEAQKREQAPRSFSSSHGLPHIGLACERSLRLHAQAYRTARKTLRVAQQEQS